MEIFFMIIEGVLLLSLPSLYAIATIKARPLFLKTMGGITVIWPLPSKKQREFESVRNRLIIEVNDFCREVANELLKCRSGNPEIGNLSNTWDRVDRYDRSAPSEMAQNIVHNMFFVLSAYRDLKEQRAGRIISEKMYRVSLVEIYKDSLKQEVLGWE